MKCHEIFDHYVMILENSRRKRQKFYDYCHELEIFTTKCVKVSNHCHEISIFATNWDKNV